MRRVFEVWRQVALAVCILASAVSTATAQVTVVRIEEDWELHVTQPDEQIDAPQVTTTMLPFGSDSDVLLQVDLNHASAPSFSKGGFQLRACSNDVCENESRHLADLRLTEVDEILSWTQVVQKVESGYVFGLKDGTSESWGNFGGNETFIWFDSNDNDSSLLAYNPSQSAENSGVTYASNRVGWLRLKKIRIYTSLGQMTETVLNLEAQ